MATSTHETPAAEFPLDRLAAMTSGDVFHPGEPGYAELATPWNVAVPSAPVAVLEARNAEDVAAAVRFAAEHGLQVGVRATGHGATAEAGPTLLVHTGRLDELVIGTDLTARVGAGCRWLDVLEACAPLGLAALAGSAPNVGVVGYLTGGGMGPVARTYGVASDLVTAFDIVTGDGVIRRATPSDNPDLFWGLRGGKGALGIVTAAEFTLIGLPEIFGGCVYFDGKDAKSLLTRWKSWADVLPEQATSSVAVFRLPEAPGIPGPLAGKITVGVRFAWVGDPDEGRRQIELLTETDTVIFGGMQVMPYANIGSIHADPVDPMPTHESEELLRELPTEAFDVLLSMIGPDAECPQMIVELRMLDGLLARKGEHPSAYSHRDAAYALLLIGIAAPPFLGPTIAQAAAVHELMGQWSTGGCLPNFMPSSDPRVIKRKYDPRTLERLGSLVMTYDPDSVIAEGRSVLAAGQLKA